MRPTTVSITRGRIARFPLDRPHNAGRGGEGEDCIKSEVGFLYIRGLYILLKLPDVETIV